jgi:hypothetical protein
MNTPFLTFYYDYDDSKYYESCANRLKTQIESAGGSLIIKSPKLTNSYNVNCLYKPTIILETLQEYKRSLIWIDADSYINKLPNEFDGLSEYDIGFVIRNHDYKTPHAALIYFNYTDNCIKFMNKWIEKCNCQLENAKNKIYDAGDHCQLIDTYNELSDINYAFASPRFASTNNMNSMVIIGISPGGYGVEARKK